MTKAAVGVSDHGGWAVLVTVAGTEVIDRRRVELVEAGVPALPHHVDGQLVPIEEGVALVERVRASAEKCARAAIAALARDVPGIQAIALRVLPALPATIEERLTNVRARNNADWAMYREALAGAARDAGWRVVWFDAKRVFADAASTLGVHSIDARLRDAGKKLGSPWTIDHRMAMAAAITAIRRRGLRRNSRRRPRRAAASRSRGRRAVRSRGRRW